MTDWTPPGPGPWQQDSAHTPVAKTEIMGEAYPNGFNRGFTETFARYGLLLDRLAMATVNGFTYHQPQPFDMPGPDGPPSEEQIHAEFERRMAVAASAFETKRWREDLALWDDECKPNSIARHRALGAVTLPSLSQDDLLAHLGAVLDHVDAMVYQHHRFNVAALLPVGDFALQTSGWLQCDPTTLLAALDGYSPVSSVASDELRAAIADLRGDSTARALLTADNDPAKRLTELRDRSAGVDEFMAIAGHRLAEGFDVVGPTLGERPELVLGRLSAALDADPDEARRRSDAFAAELRSRVPAEHQTSFDELLGEARAVYRLRDERGLYSDMTAIGLLRSVMLEVGNRLVAGGVIPEAELALEATSEELVGLVAGSTPVDAATLADRRDTRVARTAAGAPRHLGDPPPPPPPVDQLPPPLARLMAAVGFTIEGILGQLDEPAGDANLVGGIPASTGSYEGRARVVRSLDELFLLEPGDVLVTPATGEAFNSMLHLVGAIVTDHGSFACHAGIVAREMGIPAVVGTVDGSHRIENGDMVTVDGANGEVRIRS